ncbi:MAG: hypothetical protein VKJ24_07790 [Synechococcales bacterium]|nr:hypothetical protein [Synechococcales bacterium]
MKSSPSPRSPRSQWFSLLGFGVVGSTCLFAGLIILAAAQVTTLRCERVAAAQVDCEREISSFVEVVVEPLGNVQAASVGRVLPKDDRHDTRYNVSLLLEEGLHQPLGTFPSPDETKVRSQVEAINQFLQDANQTSLNLGQDDRYTIFLSGGILTIMGLLGLAIAGRTLFQMQAPEP